MPKLIKQILILICLVGVLILPYFVFAGDSDALKNLKKVGAGENGGSGPYVSANEYSLAEILGTVVKAALSLLGVIFIILIIYAGYNWMTAGGNEEQLKKAHTTINRAVIGLIIVIGAYAIWDFVFYALLND